ncbi:MAG: hypothetical protein ACKV2V_00470 [Blastocatellia bacterium]
MNARNIFTALLPLILTLSTLTIANAQTGDVTEWKKRVQERIASGERPQPAEKAAETSTPATTEATTEATTDSGTEATSEVSETSAAGHDRAIARQEMPGTIFSRRQNALAGTWDLTLTFGDGSKVKSTLTVIPGRRDGEGSIIHAAEASLLLPNPTTPEQGAWRNTGGLEFIASYSGYAVDEKFEKPAGKIGFRHAIRVNIDEETFTGRAVFEVRDADGNVVFSDNLKTEGVRRQAEAP